MCNSQCNNKYCGFDQGDCSTDVTSAWGGFNLAEHVGFDGHSKGGVGALLGGATATIRRSRFEYNTADLGGAFYVQGCTTLRASDAPCPSVSATLGDTSAITVTDSTVVGAEAERGGFVYSAIGAIVELERVRASAGRASQQGGLLWASQTTVSIKDTNVSGHVAEDGAVAYLSDSTLVMDRSEAVDGQSSRAGGALVFTDGSRGTIGNTTLSNNAALLGGAIRIVSTTSASIGSGRLDSYTIPAPSSLLVDRSTIESNVAASEGGAILLEGSATRVSFVEVHASSFDLNRCDNCNGGTLYADGGSVHLVGTAVLNSSAVQGGAMYVRSSTVQLQSTQVRGSNATLRGGGLALIGSTLNISDASVLEGNRAAVRGGALDLVETVTGIVDSDVSSNVAATGGAVASLTSAIEVRSSAVAQNAASADGGAFNMLEGSLLLQAVQSSGNEASNDGGFLHATEVVNVWRDSSLANNTARPSHHTTPHVTHRAARQLSRLPFTLIAHLLRSALQARYGGASYIDRSSIAVEGVTMSNNHAVRGGAVYVSGRHVTEGLTVANTTCRANSVVSRADVIDSLSVPIDAQASHVRWSARRAACPRLSRRLQWPCKLSSSAASHTPCAAPTTTHARQPPPTPADCHRQLPIATAGRLLLPLLDGRHPDRQLDLRRQRGLLGRCDGARRVGRRHDHRQLDQRQHGRRERWSDFAHARHAPE